MPADDFKRPFPALTPNQRVHLDVYGYVVIENALTKSEVDRLKGVMYGLEDHYRTHGKMPDGSKCIFSTSPEYFRIDNLPHVHPAFMEYVAHPRLVGMAEEAVGGVVRLEQSDAHIRRPPKDKSQQGYGFHRGAEMEFANIRNGLYHCSFVKTLTNLTDLGPDDGGTTVIAGSHKMLQVSQRALIDASKDDPRLIHQVVAPAGSTLLFFEALMHSSGIIRSDNDRLLIIGGYTPTMFQTWEGYEPERPFVESVPAHHREFLTGAKRYSWERRVRSLETPAEPWPG